LPLAACGGVGGWSGGMRRTWSAALPGGGAAAFAADGSMRARQGRRTRRAGCENLGASAGYGGGGGNLGSAAVAARGERGSGSE
jgi:hypothetical protein